jgi:outer membrane murein-binding lipoprotein Lpp
MSGYSVNGVRVDFERKKLVGRFSMMRRVMLALFIVLLGATSAWPKFKEDEQHYLDDQFKALQDQVQALATQVQTLNAQLQELRKNQAQFQAIIDRQQRSLQDLNQMVISMRLGSEEGSSNLKAAITQLRNETQAAFAKLTGVSATVPTGGGGGGGAGMLAPTPLPAPAPAYVTDVKDDSVVIDMGSSQGLHQGSRLAVFKASDPNTRVGVIEVTQVLDAGNSRAQIVTLNPGVRLEFGDVVRLE